MMAEQESSKKIITLPGRKKGIRLDQQAETVIKNEDKKAYDERLQAINDRIRSYRPNTIKDYKPKTKEGNTEQNLALDLWDGETWAYGEYPDFFRKKGVKWPEDLTEEKGPSKYSDMVKAQLFTDFKTLVKSAAVLRGYNRPSTVRGGTYQDVDDFFNFATIQLCERRLKQYDVNSPCRIWQNWPSYLAIVLPQYLIFYNKSKFDFEIEAYWPLVKDDRTNSYVPKDFGIDFKVPSRLLEKDPFIMLFNKVISQIPEAKTYVADVLMYLVYGVVFSHKELVQHIAQIVKMQMYEAEERLL